MDDEDGVKVTNLADEIAAAVPGLAVVRDEADKAPYETDWRRLYAYKADAVALPETVEQVAGLVKFCAARGLALLARCVGDGGEAGEGRWPAPEGDHALREDLNLLVGERAAGGFAEGRHQAAGDTFGGDALQIGGTGEGQIDGVCQRDGRAQSAAFAVTGRTVLFVKRGEVEDLIGTPGFGAGQRLARHGVAADDA